MAWRRGRGAEVGAGLSAVRRPTAGCCSGPVPEQHRKEFFIWGELIHVLYKAKNTKLSNKQNSYTFVAVISPQSLLFCFERLLFTQDESFY